MLSEEQDELLIKLVEAARRQPRSERQPFLLAKTVSSHNYLVIHPGMPPNDPGAYPADIDLLIGAGLLLPQSHGNHMSVDITPAGFARYASLQRNRTSVSHIVEEPVRRMLNSAGFERTYPAAFMKIREAANVAWAAESHSQWTTIGHLCREAVQAFCTELINRHKVSSASTNPANVVDRSRFVLRARNVDGTRGAFADALLAYWGTVVHLVPRQEHGATKEGKSLRPDDARRVVFQTMMVLYEVSQFTDYPE